MKYRNGQILLITVMILATALTVVLSVSFRSVTETQVTKLEEENQKALAAAEAAIEASLKTGDATVLGPGGSPELDSVTGFTGGASLTTARSDNFTTPVIPKDGSYTFYLGNYNPLTHAIGNITASLVQPVEICFQSGSPKPALEITLVKTDAIVKYIVDPEPSPRINNSSSTSSICSNSSYDYSYTIPANGSNINISAKFLLVRVLYRSTRLNFRGVDNKNFWLQGKTISSEAISTTGVSKKVTLFQSHPQVPAEFFTTTF